MIVQVNPVCFIVKDNLTRYTVIPLLRASCIIRKTKNQDFKNEKSKKTANDLLIAFIV